MRFHISHRTVYQYSEPVYLEPHTLRMIPRQDEHHRILSDHSTITPAPAMSSFCLDAEGNQVQRICFEGLHQQLTIEIELDVETKAFNPFNFFLSDLAQQLPFQLPPGRLDLLKYYVSQPSDTLVVETAAQLAEKSGYQTLHFLTSLNQFLYDKMNLVIREIGPPQPVGETLTRCEGTCRDVTTVFMEICGAHGIPSRFVSGYQANPDSIDQKHHLHAWPEVYLPGGGWRGYDPTTGLAVDEQYVPLTSSSSPSQTLPVEGGIRGSAETSMSVELNVQAQ